MAVIRPFRGLRYNIDLVKDPSLVISQPYDRVRYGLQEQYYAQSEHTIVKIIKGKAFDNDGEESNVYTRARDYLQSWMKEGVLLREEKPSLYVLHQTFTLQDGTRYTRKGFSCAFEISTFDEGVVLPHERTLSGPKADRLKLTNTTGTYYGHIFMLYQDKENTINALLEKVISGKKPLLARDLFENDVEQKLWVVDDPEIVAAVMKEMEPKKNLIIADGHHRYETAINYRDEMRKKHPDAAENAAFNFRMVTLVSMSDPGLVILPTHRLIYGYDLLTRDELLEKASVYFEITHFENSVQLFKYLEEAVPEYPRIGLYSGSYSGLQLKSPNLMEEIVPDRDYAWRMLDVSILHEILIERVMGLSKESVERKENIDYLRDPQMGYDRVDNGDGQFLFLLNPTRMEQVSACTRAGEKMPQKSTDFYPKIVSGLVSMSAGIDPL
ncbi:MAG: DUF1015 domain-containing protein [Anaerolineales bacterium]|nr:DUF1015 domain-containing protein [Anaerolineales bacterium]